MWGTPTYLDQRGVFVVHMELEGFDLNNHALDSMEARVHERFLALTLLISSQLVLLSKGNSSGLGKQEAFKDMDFIQKIKN